MIFISVIFSRCEQINHVIIWAPGLCHSRVILLQHEGRVIYLVYVIEPSCDLAVVISAGSFSYCLVWFWGFKERTYRFAVSWEDGEFSQHYLVATLYRIWCFVYFSRI